MHFALTLPPHALQVPLAPPNVLTCLTCHTWRTPATAGELVAVKGRLAGMASLETLYGAARDELDRLDKENLELKDMVSGTGVLLGRSR